MYTQIQSVSVNSPLNNTNSTSPRIYVLHENTAWVEPLRKAFEEADLPYSEWFLDQGSIDLNSIPPEGIFYNRMSASSHTRDHRFAVEFTEAVLRWLEAHGRTVVNDSRALHLEVRKFNQCLELRKFDILTPETIMAVGTENILNAAGAFERRPFILKPNRGGKGLGVQLFYDIEGLKSFLEREGADYSLDGIVLLQEYIRPADGNIVRMEFIDGRFFYAVRVDASGGFQLCPADGCAATENFCPTSPSAAKFQLIPDFDHPMIPRAEAFLRANGIRVGAMEFSQDIFGRAYVYDVNINTNYNSAAELAAGNTRRGMTKIAAFLGKELETLSWKNAKRA